MGSDINVVEEFLALSPPGHDCGLLHPPLLLGGGDRLCHLHDILPPLVEVEQGVRGAPDEFGLLWGRLLPFLPEFLGPQLELFWVLQFGVLGQVPLEEFEVDLVLLGGFGDVEFEFAVRVDGLVLGSICKVVVVPDEGGGDVVEGLVELNELKLLLLALLGLAEELGQFSGGLLVGCREQVVPGLQL